MAAFDFSLVFRVLDQATAPLVRLQRQLDHVVSKVRRVSAAARTMASRFAAMSGTFSTVGRNMSMFITAPVVALGVSIARTAAGFDEAMNGVGAVTRATSTQMEAMSRVAKQLGASTQFSAIEAAQAMKFLGMAGLNTQQVMEAIPRTLQLAAAGSMDLAQAADISTNVLTAMGMQVRELGHVNDVLALAASRSNTDVLQLGEAMTTVAPIASTLGVSVEQLTAYLGKMADGGVRGSNAGTLLRNALMSMSNPQRKAINAFRELGLNINDFRDNMGRVRNVPGMVRALREAGASAGQLQAIFGERGFRAIALLMKEGGNNLNEFTDALVNSEGAAQQMQERMMRGLPGAMKLLKSAWEGLQLAIADSGVKEMLEGIVRGLAGFIQRLSQASPWVLKLVSILIGLVAILGPLALGLGAVGTAMTFLAANPIVLTIAAIVAGCVAAAAALAGMKSRLDELRSATAESEEEMSGLEIVNRRLQRGLLEVGPLAMFTRLWDKLSGHLSRVWNIINTGILPVFVGVGDQMSNITGPFNDFINAIRPAFQPVVDLFNNFGDSVTRVKNAISELWEAVRSKGSAVLEFVGKWTGITGAINNVRSLQERGNRVLGREGGGQNSRTDVVIRVEAQNGTQASIGGQRNSGPANVITDLNSNILGRTIPAFGGVQ